LVSHAHSRKHIHTHTQINYLVQLGAERSIKNDSGETPLYIAKFKGKFGDRYVASSCSVLQCVAVCCSVLLVNPSVHIAKFKGNFGDRYVAVCCSMLQCDAACCSVLQCVAMCCTVLQCVALCCTVLHCVALLLVNPICTLLNSRASSGIGMLQCVALFGSVLQCVAAEPPLDISKRRGKFGDRYVTMC